ncbi:hypothetical protein PR202_ga21987 [Eleusine coracana subsp. coracana]|uniref:Target of rapamycin complex subunit LST8 n=1 Tax=Eleusine coracana subsp. coracana TaxID=191504 RepID=A0AAV5D2C3_ELECO|nr:hypothetical protein PR202_ga21987 [Eleusine coracana subsp. coracana]
MGSPEGRSDGEWQGSSGGVGVWGGEDRGHGTGRRRVLSSTSSFNLVGRRAKERREENPNSKGMRKRRDREKRRDCGRVIERDEMESKNYGPGIFGPSALERIEANAGKWLNLLSSTASYDHTIRFWEAKSGRCYRTIQYPDSKELVSGDQNGNIRVWDLAANSCSCELVPEVDTAVRSLTVIQLPALNLSTKLQAYDGYILKCLLSPEFCDPNRYRATASSDHTVKIWNVDGFKLEKTLVGHQRWVWDCVFSVDGAYLITASSDTTARLWTMSTGEAIRVYQGRHHKATTCCGLHDGAESAPA